MIPIGDVLNGVYDNLLGWRPASGATKPVHVANGLAIALTGRLHNVDQLHRVVVWWKRGKVVDDDRSFDAMMADDPSVVGSLADDASQFDKLRRHIGGLLNADGGLFPSESHSDFTLTNDRMATRSGNDRGLGDFGAALLRGQEDSGPLADVVRKALGADTPVDPITLAVWPLLETEGREVRTRGRATAALGHPTNREFFTHYSLAATDLASHELSQGNRLRTIERAVHFVCLSTLVQVQFVSSQASVGRTPLLLAAGGERLREVEAASAKSLDGLYRAFDGWLGEQLARRLREGLPLAADTDPLVLPSLDGRSVRAFLRSVLQADRGHPAPSDDTLNARMADFKEMRNRDSDPDEAIVLGHTLVSAYTREYTSGGPRAFLRGLNSRAGMIYPHFQGRADRRVRPNTRIVDLLVRSCVPAHSAIPIDDFLAILWERFGLVVGGRRSADWDDAAILHQHGIHLSPAALQQNADAFESHLVAMGLARRYADHVTFVGDSHAV